MDDAITRMVMDLASMLGRAWEFVQWFAGFVITTVAESIFGGWTAVMALAGVAIILFLVTRLFFHHGEG
jgi:hypothetical protein